MPTSIRTGDSGPPVIDLRDRLRSLGFQPGIEGDSYDSATQSALCAFQASKGLEPDGFCGPQTWHALDEAYFSLGDRLLCSTRPMMRGDDVAALQLKLGTLGFDAGRIDGIFGPDTQRALGDFQKNTGVVCDHVCGPETVGALERMASRGSSTSVAGLRERERLRDRSFEEDSLKVSICHLDSCDQISGYLGAELNRAGAEVAVFSGPDWTVLAQQTNEFDATVCIAIDVVDDPRCELNYFSTEGFQSHLGSRLADALRHEIPHSPHRADASVHGKRLPILRETRAPAVHLRLGTRESIAEDEILLAASIHRALLRCLSLTESTSQDSS